MVVFCFQLQVPQSQDNGDRPFTGPLEEKQRPDSPIVDLRDVQGQLPFDGKSERRITIQCFYMFICLYCFVFLPHSFAPLVQHTTDRSGDVKYGSSNVEIKLEASIS